MKPLSNKEEKVFQGLREFFSQNRKMPTIRELKEKLKEFGLNFSSTRSVFLYLQNLEEKGYIKKNKSNRYEFLLKVADNLVDLPIYGSANAGVPTLIGEQYLQGTLKVSKNLLRGDVKNFFAVEVSGSSMNKSRVNNKEIKSGDFVIVDGGYSEYKGDGSEKVLAIVDGLATVKVFKRVDEDTIGLFPDSTEKKHKPIFISQDDDFIVNGRIVDVFKTK